MNFAPLIKKLKLKGIQFDQGLTSNEIDRIEGYYQIKFPPDLKEFLSESLPISHPFVNWRDWSDDSVKKIKDHLQRPLKGIIFDIKSNDYWYDGWGVKPDNLEHVIQICEDEFKKTPKLIPIYSHRYIPEEPHEVGNPIFSVYQTDIIYYGENLTSYLEVEFGYKNHNEIDFNSIKSIKFWSDMAG